ncbi:MAG: hypothetical protein AMXMBFR66_19900 [Pseudomonadota bacterium]|nr:hypothetical protein [Rubrivivax sp.]NLZ39789.1 hypothetical protein [Comamonadaceae bacterium]
MNPIVVAGRDAGAAPAWDRLLHLLYLLHLLSWPSAGLFSVVAMAINYWKRWEAPSELHRSHLRWQSRSFWFTLIALVATSPLWLVFVFPGYFAWTLIGLWYLYRFVKGWWWFFERRPMPAPEV